MTIHINLKKLRKSANLTQQEVADLLLIKPNTYGAWEANKTYPSSYYLPKIAAIFGVNINELFEAYYENNGFNTPHHHRVG